MGIDAGATVYPMQPDRGGGTPLPEAGCYLISLVPENWVSLGIAYFGTLRVETAADRTIASGDLYHRRFDIELTDFIPLPDPKAGIPVFPIKDYCYYLRVIDIRAMDGGFSLTFEIVRFSGVAAMLFDGRLVNWTVEDTLSARMSRPPPPVPPDPDHPPVPDDLQPPAAFPSPEHYFVGDVTNAAGATVGHLKAGLVSRHLRSATVEIDRVRDAELPMKSAAGDTWQSILARVGWDLTVVPSDSDVAEPGQEMWNPGQAHDAMTERREKTDLDKEWRYHVLCVRKIKLAHASSDQEEQRNGERGHMYDEMSFGENRAAREGMMVASHWEVPKTAEWGPFQGMISQATPIYFRTAMHELGHALGLSHNNGDNGIMNTTEMIALDSLKPGSAPFPDNMMWKFAPDDEHRLRHWPDLVVRPGGLNPNSGDDSPSTALLSDRHRLDVSALRPEVRLGVPVRIKLRLTNVSGKPVDSPANLSLNAGFVRGRVVDPSGTMRTFGPLARSEIQSATQNLAPEKSLEASLALLEGGQGMLFPLAGDYHIAVDVGWNGKTVDIKNKLDFVVTAQTRVTVTPTASR